MKISYNWLSEYVNHGLPPADLADLLTMAGLEVEEIEIFGEALEGVVVGEVLRVIQHPNADRLTVCEVDIGGERPLQIVCGAPNVAAGQKVPVATVGTVLHLPDHQTPGKKTTLKLKRAKIRGQVSEGMICAEDELGLSEDHSGIMVLEPEAPVGQPFRTYLEERGIRIQDWVLDVALTPNRPDAACHIGIARDVSAITRKPLQLPEVEVPPIGEDVEKEVEVIIEDREGCGRYVALLLKNVTITESPLWLKRRIEAIGLRPRNLIVDITNYVMYEWGQPLHAFDFDKIAGQKIIIRRAESSFKFTTLDGKTREVPAGTLLICDAEKPIALAGIMGGANTEVTEETQNILIESAWFNPVIIRRAARKLNLHTDASYRFERGVDPLITARAGARAAALIAQWTEASPVPGRIDVTVQDFRPRKVVVRPERVNALLGTDIPPSTMQDLLTAIGFDIEETEHGFLCTIPTFRPDIEREVDVIEEIIRLYGYDRIPEPSSTTLPYHTPTLRPKDRLHRRILPTLIGNGLREIYTNSLLPEATARQFLSDELIERAPDETIVKTLNPISQEMAALRPSLLPGMLQVMQHNQNHGQRVLRFFEWGHVFLKTPQTNTLIPGYREWESFLFALSGPAFPRSWDTPERLVDFYDLKGLVEQLMDTLHLSGNIQWKPVQNPGSVTAYRLEIWHRKQRLGTLAQLHPALQEQYDLQYPVFFAEFDAEKLSTLTAKYLRSRYQSISRHPQVERDIAIVVSEEVPVGALIDTIRKAAGKWLKALEVFDLYTGEKIGPKKKSVAFSLRFGSDRTLREEEIQQWLERILKKLSEEHGAVLRK